MGLHKSRRIEDCSPAASVSSTLCGWFRQSVQSTSIITALFISVFEMTAISSAVEIK